MIGTGPLASSLLAILVPDQAREPFVGDLIEEANKFVAPTRGRRQATLWFWGQVLRSMPALVAAHTRSMPRRGVRQLVVVAAGVVALAQAWDSDVFGASPVVVALTVAAIGLAVAVGLVAAWPKLYVAAMVGACVLLLAARLVSPVPLPDLFFGLLPFAAIGLWVRTLDHRPAPTA